MALLTVFDDGKTEGEDIRLRGNRFLIGRTEGDLQIPHDNLMSAKHAEFLVNPWLVDIAGWLSICKARMAYSFAWCKRCSPTAPSFWLDWEDIGFPIPSQRRLRLPISCRNRSAEFHARLGRKPSSVGFSHAAGNRRRQRQWPTTVVAIGVFDRRRSSLCHLPNRRPFLRGPACSADSRCDWRVDSGTRGQVAQRHLAPGPANRSRKHSTISTWRAAISAYRGRLMVRLRVIPRAQEAFEWESQATQFRVGRSPDCELRFEGAAAEFVSWEHALFAQNGDGSVQIQDLGSSNGTWVDGARIESAVALRTGATIQLGRSGNKLEVIELRPVGRPSPSQQRGAPQPIRVPQTLSVPAQDLLVLNRNWIGLALGVAAIVGMLVIFQWGLRPAEPLSPPLGGRRPMSRQHPDRRRKPPKKSSVRPNLILAADERVAECFGAPERPSGKRQKGPAAGFGRRSEDRATWLRTCAAVIGEHALLTTATVATDLAEFLQKGGGYGWRNICSRKVRLRTPCMSSFPFWTPNVKLGLSSTWPF